MLPRNQVFTVLEGKQVQHTWGNFNLFGGELGRYAPSRTRHSAATASDGQVFSLQTRMLTLTLLIQVSNQGCPHALKEDSAR